MRTIYTYICVLLMVALSACHRDEGVGVDFASLPNLGHRFIPASQLDYDLSQQPMAVCGRRDASSIDGIGLLRGMTDALTCSIRQVSGIYNTVDAYGKPVWLSGAVYYPKSGTINGIIVSCHYTVCADYEVPSQSCFMDAWLATKGYVVVMPDYMGYGSTVDSIHPYMQAELTVHHILDMALAVRPFFADEGLTILSDEIILMGYSQGAHAAMHALKWVEEAATNEYKTAQLRVKRCCCGGGPYYVSDFYRRCVRNNHISIPCGVPLLVLGMEPGWNWKSTAQPFANSNDYRTRLFSAYSLANYQDWILSKRYTVDQLSTCIGTGTLTEILSNKACDLWSTESKAFQNVLTKHDVPSTYAPQTEVWIFHSLDDDIIHVSYAQKLQQQFITYGAPNATFDIDHYGVHGMAFARFLLKIYKTL